MVSGEKNVYGTPVTTRMYEIEWVNEYSTESGLEPTIYRIATGGEHANNYTTKMTITNKLEGPLWSWSNGSWI